ncbi:hypothetical protein NQ314_018954 [Rhamnusium bicolor]|uniref:Uncharacterized protein n=1 Tax=Rhamnusium bicolor TaxID=1586634 RepID=A0AAV8WPQ2_9CUCU|nr:hypothetical protein NQ314_018954 [Rhamnusium bicolor]
MILLSVRNAINFCANDESDSMSSSPSNESDEEDDLDAELQLLYTIIMIGETRGEQKLGEKISDYVERVVPSYTRNIFREHFR